MKKGTIISLFDYTGVMVDPWVKAGYKAIIVDIQHAEGMNQDPENPNLWRFGGNLRFEVPFEIPEDLVFICGFPPCTNTAVSGAAHFLKKGSRAIAEALDLFATVKELGEKTGVPYFIENPVSTFSSYIGSPDYSFHPYEYGGYLPENDIHPLYPNYIASRDAYPKKTCLWTGNGFIMPPKKKVGVERGYSAQHKKLGGKSIKTKNIRSATPRGFAEAVFQCNNLDHRKRLSRQQTLFELR